MSGLTAWDWFVLVAFALSIGFGVARGMVRSIFAIGAWVVAFLGTPLAGSLLIQAFSLQSGGLWLYLLAFVLLFVLVRLIGRLVADGLKKVGLGGPDRLLGGALGVLRALVIVAVAAVAASATGMDRDPAWTGALSRPLLDALVARLEPFLPERVSGVRRT
jgi:membrane protein required for colicin V production